MRQRLFFFAFSLLFAGVALAQTKVDDLTKQIQDIDAKIEATIGDLAARLEKVKDSPDSGGRVAKVKKDFMADLEKSINLYRLERDKRIDKIGRPSTAAATESLQKSTAALDARLDTRADQIVAIAKSFNESDGYREYVTVYDDDGGQDGNMRRETDESVQKRREGSRASQNEKAVVDGLKRSMTDLDQRKAALERRLAATTTDDARAAIQEEIDRIAAKREARVQQIQSLESEGSDAGASAALSPDQAFALDKEVDALVAQLKTDFRELLRLANEREVARARGK